MSSFARLTDIARARIVEFRNVDMSIRNTAEIMGANKNTVESLPKYQPRSFTNDWYAVNRWIANLAAKEYIGAILNKLS